MPHKTKCVNGWEWPFLLNTEERCYVLLAQTESDMRRWIDAYNSPSPLLSAYLHFPLSLLSFLFFFPGLIN